MLVCAVGNFTQPDVKHRQAALGPPLAEQFYQVIAAPRDRHDAQVVHIVVAEQTVPTIESSVLSGRPSFAALMKLACVPRPKPSVSLAPYAQ